MATFRMTLLMNNGTNIAMEMDAFVHWPKPHLLLSRTCDETWMIASWMENYLVSDATL
jgi:hypothetical protein